MVIAYGILKLLHILLAIVAVGFTTTFGITMAGAVKTPPAIPHALQTVARLEKISTPAFHSLLVTGVILGWMGGTWKTLWFQVSLGLILLGLTIATTVAKPTLRKQLALIESATPDREELQRLGNRSKVTGMVLMVNSLCLIALMVFKPEHL